MRLTRARFAPALLLAAAACADRVTAAVPAAPRPLIETLSGKSPRLVDTPRSTSGAWIRICQYSGMVPERAPLYVIEGRPVAHNDLHAIQLAPDQIARIEILRSAAAIGRFGVVGANGAVLITLKH